ncbi:sugar lactone lactonase [Acrasis kona]|uniref:Sugar lactone lactonase n=1 Tax=Acrasis kona TaxID=1008807 RepID=A0AAW2ZLQ7_9EUKA
MSIIEASIELDHRSSLGEGPFYVSEMEKLLWIDINKHTLMLYDPKTKANKSFDLGEFVGFVVSSSSGGAVVGLTNGLAKIEFIKEGSEVVDILKTYIIDVESHIPGTRFNDGKCDPNGLIWAGTMHIDEQTKDAGSLYSFSTDQGQISFKKQLSPVSISNGIVWNHKGDKMYYIDTPTLTILEFDYQLDQNIVSIHNKKVVFNVPPEWSAGPDGMCIDTDDKLWVAFYGNSTVCRIDPIQQKVLCTINVPGALNVTAAAFGGQDLRQLYITTASQHMSEEELKKHPNSGFLFKADLTQYFEEQEGDVRGALFNTFNDK